MNKKIFRSMFLVSLALLVISLGLVTGISYKYFNTSFKNSLLAEAKSFASIMEKENGDWMKEIESPHRITWISGDGKVIYDNMADEALLENHLDRKEVMEAMENGEGTSERYSATLSEKTVYTAVRLSDGSVLRVSDTRNTTLQTMISMWKPLFIILILITGASLLVSLNISKSITEPINKIDLEHPSEAELYPELRPLTEKIEEQNKQIKLQMDELCRNHEIQDAMRREFTANVSHELKTPLTSISGFAEIMRDGLVKKEDISNFSGKIYNEAQRLIVLVEDIIKLSRLEAEEVGIEKELIDLYDICAEEISHLKAACEKKDVSFSLSGSHCIIYGAPMIVSEMVYNLCDNAVKYNKQGGRADVSVKETEDGVVLTVSDTGIGIPKEELSRVFERFYRVNKSHSKEVGGTGLGLSIVKHGAIFHDARIDISSEPDKGTEISITWEKPSVDKS